MFEIDKKVETFAVSNLVVSWSLRVRCRLFCNSTYMLFTYISPPRNKQGSVEKRCGKFTLND